VKYLFKTKSEQAFGESLLHELIPEAYADETVSVLNQFSLYVFYTDLQNHSHKLITHSHIIDLHVTAQNFQYMILSSWYKMLL